MNVEAERFDTLFFALVYHFPSRKLGVGTHVRFQNKYLSLADLLIHIQSIRRPER